MTTITAALVKELRDLTNAGMMECKKALTEASGDLEKAIEILRKTGQAKAVNKAGRAAAEGTIKIVVKKDGKSAVLLEVNCETDFVAREERFRQFAEKSAQLALEKEIRSIEELQKAVEDDRLSLVAALGENITPRRLVVVDAKDGVLGTYGHGDANTTRIGVAVVLKKGTPELARDLAMHIAAMNPEYLTAAEVPQPRIDKEKEIFTAQTREEGKPEAMLDKIVAGKIKKFCTDITLLGQHFVKDPSKTIESLLKESGAEVQSFTRLALGEGVEKKQDNFAAEVMAQARGQ